MYVYNLHRKRPFICFVQMASDAYIGTLLECQTLLAQVADRVNKGAESRLYLNDVVTAVRLFHVRCKNMENDAMSDRWKGCVVMVADSICCDKMRRQFPECLYGMWPEDVFKFYMDNDGLLERIAGILRQADLVVFQRAAQYALYIACTLLVELIEATNGFVPKAEYVGMYKALCDRVYAWIERKRV